MQYLKYIFALIFVTSCKSIVSDITQTNNLKLVTHDRKDFFKSNLNKFELVDWYQKDIKKDSIPGISLNIAYKNFLSSKAQSEKVVVALIDSEFDIYNKDIKDQIWVNTNEIPDNGVDDDNNGYVDDIHGWNFIGTNENDAIPYVQFISTRILKKFESIYSDLNNEQITSTNTKSSKMYQQAKKVYDQELQIRKDRIAMFRRMIRKYNNAKVVLDSLYGSNYSKPMLDSLKKKVEKNSEIYTHADNMSYYLKYNYNPQWLEKQIKNVEYEIGTFLNKDYNGRLTLDDPDDINDSVYGNNNVNGTGRLGHALKVASIIGAKRGNGIGIDGIIDNVSIMSLNVTTAGDEYDKDIALAIRYAVDNGAAIINMSVGRELSMYPEWVENAIKYAEKKDVLVITSSGNNGYNLEERTNYPNDSYKGKEFVSNFIKVGHTTYNVDSTFVDSFSNYGKTEVDIFAPGSQIYTNGRSSPTLASGSSYAAPMVSGIAALIRSYYPKLTAVEVKQIIMESGVSFDIMVLKPYADGEKRDLNKVPFSSLSKSGKIVNAYNALLMAEEVSKKKKKKRN